MRRNELPQCEWTADKRSHKNLCDRTLAELWQLFPIQLTAPNPKWKTYYADIEKRLSKLLECWHPRLHHIGSTAIDSIWAKPIVDVLVEFDTSKNQNAAAELLAANGFLIMSRENNRISLNLGYTKKGFAEKAYHVHLRLAGDTDELYFRDYLNAHPDTAKDYEQLQLGLWKKYEFDRDGYTAAKSEFIQNVLSKAMKE